MKNALIVAAMLVTSAAFAQTPAPAAPADAPAAAPATAPAGDAAATPKKHSKHSGKHHAKKGTDTTAPAAGDSKM